MSSDVVYLLEAELEAPDGSATTVLRSASRIVTPCPPDEPERPDACWSPDMREAPNYTLELYSDAGSGVGGGAVGEVKISNTDGRYSAYRGWSVTAIRLWVGAALPAAESTVLAGMTLVLASGGGTASAEPSVTDARDLILPLSDPRDRLADHVTEATYLGTSSGPDGYEGPESQAGWYKSLALGDLSTAGVPATLVNGSSQTWQPGETFASVVAIRDRGAPSAVVLQGDLAGAAFDAAAPAAGQFYTDKARGLVRAGGGFGGTVTFDLMGDPAAGTTAPEIIKWLLQRRGFTDFGPGFTDPALAPAAVGIWTGTTSTSYQSLIDRLARSAALWVVPDPLGTWQIGKLRLPVGEPVASFGASDIISLDAGNFGYPDPIHSVTVKWGEVFQTFSRDQLAGEVTDEAEISRLKEQWRQAVVSDPAVKARYSGAQSLEIETALRHQADAEALAATLLALFGVPRLSLKLTTPLTAAARAVRLGREVHLDYPEDGIVGDFLCVGLQPAGPDFEQIALQLWGALP